MFQTTTLLVVASIITALAAADDKFEMELAKSIRSQLDDSHFKNSSPFRTSN
jgi:hypothetical protein